MNATHHFLKQLNRQALIGVWAKRFGEHPGLDVSTITLRENLLEQFRSDLGGFLNCCNRNELDKIALDVGCNLKVSIGEMRLALWERATVLEQTDGVLRDFGSNAKPSLLRGKVVFLQKGNGIDAVSSGPVFLDSGTHLLAFDSEPDDIEELLRRAECLRGEAIPMQGRDKGGYGAWIAERLGLIERGLAEPDWQGEVEVKTLPVAKDGMGHFYVSEDPAIAMENVDPLLKLKKVLWVSRSVDEKTSRILGWYYQVWNWDVERLIKRDLHQRPKGGKGATTKGWYLHKRFFIDSGLLYSLESRRESKGK